MKISFWVSVGVMVAVIGVGRCRCGEVFSNFENDVLTIPAEAGELTAPMQVGEDESMEGGKYVFTPSGNKGLAAYRIRTPKAGKYYLFAHASAEDSTTDSFFVDFDAAPSLTDPRMVWDVDSRSKAFWQAVTGRKDGSEARREWDLDAGEHTLYVGGRENLAKLDILALSMVPDPKLRPVGPPLDLGKYHDFPPPDIEGRVPLIYYINYGDRYFLDPTYVDGFKDAPPDVVHIGKAVPITHIWGPVPILFGENQATGGPGHTLNRDNIRLLSPEELRARIRLITDTVARLHAVGVHYVMPYICECAIAGDPEKREGFWGFYDRWDDYREWVGPKPPDDPKEWLFRNAKGEIISVYGPTFFVPYFAPLQRYGACPNNPHWRNFQKSIIRLTAKCGYDGIFIDNCGSGGDYCKYCRDKFRTFVASIPADELKRRFFVEDPAAVELGEKTPAKLLDRFHRAMLRDYVVEMRDAGREVNPKFVIFPNTGALKHSFVLGEGCALGMWENTFPSGIAIEGEPPETDSAGIRVVADAVPGKPMTYAQSFAHDECFSELAVETALPTVCAVNRPVTLTVKVLCVGNSNDDDDAIEDVCLLLQKEEAPEAERLAFSPAGMIGGALPEVKQKPPVSLTATWTPKETGAFVVKMEYKYTDRAHGKESDRVVVQDQVRTQGCIYPNHIADFGLAGCGRMRVIPYGQGQNSELALAECAAFGRGASASATEQWAVAKFQRFFRAHADLYDKAEPYADTAILGAYWGNNPGNALRMVWPSVGDRLSEQHVLFKSLVDGYVGAGSLDGLKTLILVCDDYDLSPEGQEALKRFVAQGGRIIVAGKAANVKGIPLKEVIGADRIETWDWSKPPEIGPPICPSRGRLRGLRLAAYTDAAGKRLLLHAVNFNVGPIGGKTKAVTPLENVAVTIPVPENANVTAVAACGPDHNEENIPLKFTRDGRNLSFVLPKLRIYEVIEVQF